jgi:hypothetical protein
MGVSNNKILQKYTNPPSHNIFTLLSEQHLFASNFSEAAGTTKAPHVSTAKLLREQQVSAVAL